MNNFYTWLKDNGQLLITDFCCGNTPFSQDLIDYARSGMYTLTSIQQYLGVRQEKRNVLFIENISFSFFKLLKQCGFVQVKVEDCSDLYQQYCLNEIEIAEKNRNNPHPVRFVSNQ